MARRRLKTILATTVLAAGLSAAPASAQTVSGLTETVEDTVEETTETVTETVDDTTDAVDDVAEETTGAVEDATGTGGSQDADDDSSSDDSDGGSDIGSTVEDTVEKTTKTVDDTVEQTTKVVEDTTRAVTDAVDSTSPDDGTSPSPSGGDGGGEDGGRTGTENGGTDGAGGFLRGDGVVAAGSDDSRSAQDPNGASSGGSLAEALAAFGALGRSGASDTNLTGDGTTSPTDLPAPQVADPNAQPFDGFPDSSEVEKPVMASGPADPTDSSAALLKVFAALLLLGTGVTAKRAVENA